MDIESKRDRNGQITVLPAWAAWADCDLFCIHHYAGTGAPPCGWRGRLSEARRDEASVTLICPRCGCARLFRLLLDR